MGLISRGVGALNWISFFFFAGRWGVSYKWRNLYMAFCSGYLFTNYLVPLSMALDNAPVCLFKWKLRSKLWRWRKVLRATLRIDPWATLANTAFLNSLKREALVRAAPSTNHKWVTTSVNFLFRNSKSSIHLTTVNSLLMDGHLFCDSLSSLL